MSGLFLKLLNMSISASVLIVVVVLARCLLRKSPKWIHCILWALVGAGDGAKPDEPDCIYLAMRCSGFARICSSQLCTYSQESERIRPHRRKYLYL